MVCFEYFVMEFEDFVECIKIFYVELCYWFVLFSILVLRVLKKRIFCRRELIIGLEVFFDNWGLRLNLFI